MITDNYMESKKQKIKIFSANRYESIGSFYINDKFL